ncbi:molybdenum cofactor biosynthesis protein [Paenibacillus macquariensis subsp. defensor]|nr:molybdenum cofactor biosynthesis protein [Paenibacillus macquariensis subsp. defensor]
MNSVEQHRSEGPATVSCMIITVSDTRNKETDTSGQLMISLLQEAGYTIIQYVIVKDDYDDVRELIYKASMNQDIQAVLLSGGTGISPRDTTYEAVSSILDRKLPGFGEIFRFLSFTEDIGSAAIMSRATAGTVGTTAVFSMPGSKGAVKLALERIIIPELRHVIKEIHKKS